MADVVTSSSGSRTQSNRARRDQTVSSIRFQDNVRKVGTTSDPLDQFATHSDYQGAIDASDEPLAGEREPSSSNSAEAVKAGANPGSGSFNQAERNGDPEKAIGNIAY